VNVMENAMNTNDFTAYEATIRSRAKSWIPKNMRDLARVDPSAAKNLMAELYTDLFFHESQVSEEVIMDAQALVPELRSAIGIRTDERFAAVFLDHGRRVLGRKVYEGGSRTRTVLYPRQLFKDALKLDATGLVLAHNHPGGSTLPSMQDRELTRRVQDLGQSLEVTLIDHLIITAESHASFREAGWM
jgi:DNA repair protein RadC